MKEGEGDYVIKIAIGKVNFILIKDSPEHMVKIFRGIFQSKR